MPAPLFPWDRAPQPVDFKAYKNMVGAFYMPQFVYMNISALKTLPAREYRSGFGEIIKHGLILDRQFYDWLAKNRDELLKMDAEFVTEMVYRSLLVKKQVVKPPPVFPPILESTIDKSEVGSWKKRIPRR